MANVDALKALYTAMGGNITNDYYSDIADGVKVGEYSQISDCILALAKLVASIGIELPAVTGLDNGNVLTVVEGAWAKASIPSQLPAVTPEDAGSVLKVNESGVWAKGTDATE